MLLRVLLAEPGSSTMVAVSCCTTSSTGSTSLIEYSLTHSDNSLVSERSCPIFTRRITAHRFPLVHVDSCVPPTATYLQYRDIGLTPMAIGLSQSLAQQSGTVSRISSGTRQSALTLSDVCWRRICLRDTSACSALEVDDFMRYINLLTYLLTYLLSIHNSDILVVKFQRQLYKFLWFKLRGH